MTEHLAESALKLIQELESYKGKLPPFQVVIGFILYYSGDRYIIN